MIATIPTVAIVDDDLSVRRGLERLLRSAGYRVESFASAREFLAHPEPAGTCCLVLDVSMPGQSGLHLYDALLANGLNIPVIFIAGHDDLAIAARALKAGAAEFLSKPFEDEELLRAVAQAASRRKSRGQLS
ncbi:MAG TPA: response regulator [Myxococcales bacterium]|nr:response regulator [Myxococcales bacterium]